MRQARQTSCGNCCETGILDWKPSMEIGDSACRESFSCSWGRRRTRREKTKPAMLFGLIVGMGLIGGANSQQLSDAQVGIVGQRMAELSLLTWEIGTHAQTILEANATMYSVLSSQSLPPPSTIPSVSSSLYSSPQLSSSLTPFFDIARKVVGNRTMANNGTVGPQPLMPDSSAADPANIGICVLIANWTGMGIVDGLDYAGAAKDQLDFLLERTPRTEDGAISHRADELQLWNDFVYMVPPFLSYYGVLTRNRTLVEEGYNQIKLYRQHLRDPDTGLWHHVMLGSVWNDPGYWATGHGWAAAGMLRVLGTLRNSEYDNTFKNEQKDLADWVADIHDSVYKHLNESAIFTNYLDQPPNPPWNFYDAASSALVASTVYRASVMTGQNKHIANAERVRKALSALRDDTSDNGGGVSSDFSSVAYKHFTAEGYLTPVVNPHSFGVEGKESAEGQAFVVQMETAWREWQRKGNSARRRSGEGFGILYTMVAIGIAGLLV